MKNQSNWLEAFSIKSRIKKLLIKVNRKGDDK